MSMGGSNTRICGGTIHNGARYEFVSLSGDFKWVYCELLKHMKKWASICGHITVNDNWLYSVLVRDNYIRIYRWKDGYVCTYRRED